MKFTKGYMTDNNYHGSNIDMAARILRAAAPLLKHVCFYRRLIRAVKSSAINARWLSLRWKRVRRTIEHQINGELLFVDILKRKRQAIIYHCLTERQIKGGIPNANFVIYR